MSPPLPSRALLVHFQEFSGITMCHQIFRDELRHQTRYDVNSAREPKPEWDAFQLDVIPASYTNWVYTDIPHFLQSLITVFIVTVVQIISPHIRCPNDESFSHPPYKELFENRKAAENKLRKQR